jgi:transcriptional regulator with XRE-family HTH domain
MRGTAFSGSADVMEQQPPQELRFGLVISDARRKLGISQRELADRIRKENGEPISPQYLNDLERDRRNPPSEHLLAQFATELRLPLDYLSFVAGQLPPELRGLSAEPKQVAEAFKAFRRTLGAKRE